MIEKIKNKYKIILKNFIGILILCGLVYFIKIQDDIIPVLWNIDILYIFISFIFICFHLIFHHEHLILDPQQPTPATGERIILHRSILKMVPMHLRF